MPGKPFQSKLRSHEDEIRRLMTDGHSYRKIAELLADRHGLRVTHNAVYSFVRASARRHKFGRRFYDGLDPDIREGLLKQVVAVWTYGSNAIEGNTLTLGETMQVLELGLTIGGKPLRDHEEAYGHARAIDIILKMVDASSLEESDLFDLHRAVMPKSPVDAINPIGGWKRDYNGTTGVVGGKAVYVEYASPADVPSLMETWLKQFDMRLDSCADSQAAISLYAWAHMSFVRIHPFFDGNGRMARLLANVPVLRAGLPPILISPERRGEYIDILWRYQSSVGVLRRGEDLLPEHLTIGEFRRLLENESANVMQLIQTARDLQQNRARGRSHSAARGT